MILDERITLNEADAPNIPEEVNELIDQDKWQDAYDYPNSREGIEKYPNVASKEVQDYVVNRLANSENFRCIQNDAKDILKKLLVEMGLESRTNPYIEYFTNMSRIRANTGLFTKENMIALNNLLADSVIKRDELTKPADLDINSNDMKGLLYEPPLFKDKTANDVINIVKEYKGFKKNYLDKLPNNIEEISFFEGDDIDKSTLTKENLRKKVFADDIGNFKSWSDIDKSLNDLKKSISNAHRGNPGANFRDENFDKLDDIELLDVIKRANRIAKKRKLV